MIYLDLTPAQKKQFEKLKAAYKACKKAGILFANCYGSLEAYDHSIVEDYADNNTYNEDDDDVISSIDFHCANSMRIANEWADDKHLIKLTPKGKKKLLDGEL